MKLNKPKFWDLGRPNLISYILIPFTIIFRINNLIINNYKKLKPKEIKSICVGNIYIGGTGKTPLTIKLYNIISNFNKKTVVVKKYYTSHKDEITLLKKYTNLIFGKDRKQLIIRAIKKKYQVAIFDDGLQDKRVDYDIKFVCFDSQLWIGNGFLIPAGPLRETIESLIEYDAVFIKHTSRQIDFRKKNLIIKRINPKIKIFNSFLKIKNINSFNLNNRYLVFSGIGNNKNFRNTLLEYKFIIEKEITFPDHFRYNNNDIIEILSIAEKRGLKIVTTEKDYVKIPKKFKNKISFIKLSLEIIEEKELIKFIKSKINENN
jgi:tetraacyldisaccharide 4'-kinase